MVALAPPDDAALVVTVSPMLVAGVGTVLLAWITVLTVLVLRRCREPWRDDGRPVFQRLPDGRIRFSWGVATQLAAAQRQTMTEHDETDTLPIERRVTVIGGTGSTPFHIDRGRTS